MESHYDVLGLSPDASHAEVREAYRTLLKEYHPDHGGSRAAFLRIKTAYERITGEDAPEGRETDGGAVTRTNPDGIDPTYPIDSSERSTAHGPTVRGTYLRLTLSGLVRERELRSIVPDYDGTSEARRTVAFFEVENVGDRPLTWRGREGTSFVGDDGFMYEGSSIVTPHVDRLPPTWCASAVTVQPGRALNGLVIAQELPDDVEIESVIYTQDVPNRSGAGREETERYLFDLKPSVRATLDEIPFSARTDDG